VPMLVLIRHGQSAWNLENRFTGWWDVDVTEKGAEEARLAGELMAAKGLDFDMCFTSLQTRAIKTLDLALEAMGRLWLPVEKDWRLNERHYGGLTGLNKAETAAKHGDEQVHIWRRSFDIPPPPLEAGSEYDLSKDRRYAGIAIPNTELWIVDENDRRVGPGVVGQLVIRGATVMKGYWEKPEATAKKLKPGPVPGEMVLYTGDYCRLDDEGYLYFVGRMDDVIKSRGEKVAPKEVELVLMNIPGVKEAAVIGVPDPILGHAVKAFVVLETGTDLHERQLQKECQSRLENFMVPKYIVTVPSLPKTDTGKIRKINLQ